MQAHRIPYAQTGKFSGLVSDYIAQESSICCFFNHLPTVAGFKQQLADRADFDAEKRTVLVRQLKAQYAHLQLKNEEAIQIDEHIESLVRKNTFTVTTGHQLCLFTGPLYTIYKIVHTIRLAEELREQFPDKHVVPIFWMATEDHDFAEVNHVKHNGEKLIWESEAGDAVGRMTVEDIGEIIEKFAAQLPRSITSDQIIADLKSAYGKNNTLAEATRLLVHQWFGHKGLLILDGDDAELKKAMIPSFKKELVDQVAFQAVTETSEKLSKKYKVQVTAREINLFYLRDGFRSRIVEQDGIYSAIDTNFSWSKSAILAELENNPEHFSPNVLLRPLYQETILPNLGYIGGGGELAYWAELKDMFAAFQVPFPVVLLRQSIQLEPKRLARKRQKLNLTFPQLFGKYDALAKKIVQDDFHFSDDLNLSKEQVSGIFDTIKESVSNVDVSLNKHVEAQKVKMLQSLATIEKKLVRAAKKKDNVQLRMLQEWQSEMMPGGGLQERHDNIVPHWAAFGNQLWDAIYAAVEPLNFEFIVLTEE